MKIITRKDAEGIAKNKWDDLVICIGEYRSLLKLRKEISTESNIPKRQMALLKLGDIGFEFIEENFERKIECEYMINDYDEWYVLLKDNGEI